MILLKLIFLILAFFFGVSFLLGALAMRGGSHASQSYKPRDPRGKVIEGEYTVVKEEKSDPR